MGPTFWKNFRPYRSTAYVDAALCYTDRVAWSVGRSVCGSVCDIRQPCKTAEPIEMPFELRTRWAQGKCIRWGPDPRMRRGNIEEKGAAHRPLEYTYILRWAVTCTETAEPIEMPFGLWHRMSPENHTSMRVQIHLWKNATLRGKGGPF